MSYLSLVVIAKNEERTLGDVLSAARPLVAEIVLVDSGSTDRTVEIAQQHGARVVFQEWLGYSAQKNFALSLASNDWVLSLDADEVLSPDLVAEIRRLNESGSLDSYDGYDIPRILYIGDQAITHGGFYPDAQLRLFRRSRGKFNERAVHERVFVDGTVGRLHHAIRHYSYKDVAGFEQAMEKYARLSAQHYIEKGYGSWRVSPVNEMLHPLWTFFYRYIVRAGFLDGSLGLKLNLIYSDYVRKKIRYLKEAVQAKLV
jgi:glycosyltransferase involved in cell wall biosynthesis